MAGSQPEQEAQQSLCRLLIVGDLERETDREQLAIAFSALPDLWEEQEQLPPILFQDSRTQSPQGLGDFPPAPILQVLLGEIVWIVSLPGQTILEAISTLL